MKKSIRACRKCRKPIHEKSLHEYCESCYKKIEEVFEQIRDYLREFPGATSYEMEQRLGIPVHVINNFVKDGRLVEMPNEFLNIQCIKCNCLLLSAYHKYCPACEVKMIRELDDAKEALTPKQINTKEKGKMHFKSFNR
ncbi:hypothetical protein RH915_01295 [Serpentinicella sp. ANB-PHB4]|uniref:hypothetical protein n=1 Tax=Serpentinicella sp. ANB-PHB4 TaxID=3074076 RepID=UPI0028574B02|nr:hypothetical protein [Serpentinicella sp. ANB-PHB4]MDR5658114.1 hypothetical protein [Serpentinicella sp. ANB-PHB4]